MKPIARALADATRQLEHSSDTSRLDAELLMAEALHELIDALITEHQAALLAAEGGTA